jgi:RNA-directed DNA polymerase
MATTATSLDEWKSISWKRCERDVFKLQTRIYRASRRGDARAVHRLQRLMGTSWAAKCLAVRRVTQDNRGKNTAGVDGVKALSPHQRWKLAQTLRISQRAQATRRVWIPKPGSEEQRPLSIPTMRDRAAQALAKLALEPEWEAHFEPNSYGFRPGRSGHDAIGAIFNAVSRKPKYVLDADIAKCFDRISHKALLAKLHTTPTFRRAIKAWLEAGVMDGPTLFPTEEGTPQGGVVSPLLANIALHGLETAVQAAFPSTHLNVRWKPTIIRYADDFVILHEDLTAVERARQVTAEWLRPMGLELQPRKTRIVHTLREHDGQCPGFDFLGFNVRQHPVGKTHSGRLARPGYASTQLGFKTIIKPSKDAIRRHSEAIREVIRRSKSVPQVGLIILLNPIISGWARYFRNGVSTATFAKMDRLTFANLFHWAVARHRNKPRRWIASKYWHPDDGPWNFSIKGGLRLRRHRDTPIRRYAKVQGDRSPFDGDWVYWGTRLGRHPNLPGRVALLLRVQKGACCWCKLHFRDGDVLEVDHILPAILGGTDGYSNRQLLHRHCHDEKTAADGSTAVRGAHDKSQTVEEPDAGKLARPVLEPGGGGDPVA